MQAVTKEHVVGFRDQDHWWRWQWSHGQRRLLEQVPEASADAFRRAAYAALDRLRRSDGTFGVRFVVRYTVACRPADDRSLQGPSPAFDLGGELLA